eukprot:352346-Rhodomonas_salina.1
MTALTALRAGYLPTHGMHASVRSAFRCGRSRHGMNKVPMSRACHESCHVMTCATTPCLRSLITAWSMSRIACHS